MKYPIAPSIARGIIKNRIGIRIRLPPINIETSRVYIIDNANFKILNPTITPRMARIIFIILFLSLSFIFSPYKYIFFFYQNFV